MVLFHLTLISILFLLFLSGKDKEIVEYILRQQKAGHKDGRIRVQMEVHGHTPEMLNNYFLLADKKMQQKAIQNYFVVVLFVAFFLGSLFFLGENTGLTGAVTSTVTGAISWSSLNPTSWFTSYDCGDDYPADTDYVMDLSDCVEESLRTKNNLFCYLNNTEKIASLSPSGSNDDWYLSNLGVNLKALRNAGETTIDSVALLGKGIVFPWTATYDNVDCFSWDHGIVRTKDLHLCNETVAGSSKPPNMVFYYTDAADGLNVSYGGLSTSLVLNSSYYLCYDELECTTKRDVCDEDAGSYCVGRLDSTSGSSWYPCDTTLDADYYRCCEGGCEGIEMECAGRILNQEGTAYANFTSCVEDGTSGCCDDTTDCVYDRECYDFEEVTTFYDTNMVCSDENTWCPYSFTYDPDFDRCIPEQEACYDSNDEAYCNSIFGTDDIDIWEADNGCTRADPEGTYYYEGCIIEEISGIDYYFYQDITWY